MKAFKSIQYEVQDRIGTIILNEPEKHNALSHIMLSELHNVLMDADNNDSIHCIVIKANGPSFCAGYDISQGNYNSGLDETANYRGAREIDDDCWQMERSNEKLLSIFDLHKPVIAQVHGNCLAGGTDLAFMCDMVICSDDAVFGFPAARGMGTLPTNMWLYHTSPQWAKRLFFTGDTICGKDAAKIGLVLKSVPQELLEAETKHLLRRMALIDHHVLSCNKRVLNMGLELMGAKTLQRFAAEMDARGHKAPASKQFIKSIKEHGLKGAFKKRDAPFGDSMVSIDQPEATGINQGS